MWLELRTLCIWGKNAHHPDTYGAFCKIVRIFEWIKWLLWLFFINVCHIFWSRSLHVPFWCPPLFLFKKVASRVFSQVLSSSHVYMSLFCVFSHSLLLSFVAVNANTILYLFIYVFNAHLPSRPCLLTTCQSCLLYGTFSICHSIGK